MTEDWKRADYHQSEESDVDEATVLEELKQQTARIQESDTIPDLAPDAPEATIDYSILTSDEKLELINRHSPELLRLLEIYNSLKSCSKETSQALSSACSEYLSLKSKLISLLNLNFSFYFYLLSSGIATTTHPVVKTIKKLYSSLEGLSSKDSPVVQDASAPLSRPTPKSLLQHKGIQRKRKKLDRNVRVKNKVKYQRKVHKRTTTYGFTERHKPISYSGESTGIKKHLVKSVKLQ